MSTHIEKIEHIENAHFHNNDKPTLPSNIPSPKGFIGREVELIALQQAKTDGKTSFVLHGIGGVGKTDLALKFIDEIKADYSAHIRVDMFGLSDKPTTANDAKLEVIRMFKPDVPANLDDKDINNLYISLLNQHKTILLFDNAKDRNQLIPLCKDVPAFVVITSRTNLYVAGCFSLPVEQMSPADARNLLYSVADEARFDGQADALAYLAGYLPMALLPLGSMLAEYITLEANESVDKYEKRKAERLQLADPNRENLTVMASFDLSYERLSEELQACWRKLAVFPADFDLEAIQAVWQIEDGKTISGELVKKHLLEFNKDTKRFHLHDLSRDYTSEKLSDEERFQSEFHHSFHFGLLLTSINQITHENLDKFDFEQINIQRGFGWIKDKIQIDENLAKLCLNYTASAQEILSLRLHPLKNIEWIEIGVSATQALNKPILRGNLLGKLGQMNDSLGEYKKAIYFYKTAITIAKQNKDTHSEGNHLGDLAVTYINLSEYKKARLYCEQALAIAKKTNNLRGEGIQLQNIGNIYLLEGNYRISIQYYEKALIIAQETKNRVDEGVLLGNLGTTNLHLGNIQIGIKYSELGLSIAKEFGNRESEVLCLCYLGNSSVLLNENSDAIEYFEQALKIAKEIDYKSGIHNLLSNLGAAYSNLGDYETAVNYCEDALNISKEIGDRLGEGGQLGNLGIAFDNLGEKEKAKDYYLQALAIFEAIGSPQAKIVRQNLSLLENES